MRDDERAKLDAYLGKGVRQVETESSLLKSTSRWLNSSAIRDLVAIWLLRKNGPDFPVEADHTLGMAAAVAQVQPAAEVEALIAEERKINPGFDQFFKERFLSRYTNADFDQYAPGTVGGIMGRQIREFGFDLTLGRGDWSTVEAPVSDYEYWRLRNGQLHDFEHIASGGQFNSIGEIVVVFARMANHATHLSPKLAQALNVYLLFTGLRFFTRSLLHYPETWLKAVECVEQGLKVGRESKPIWTYRFEDVMHLTPERAREVLGVKGAYEVDSARESAIFREEPWPHGDEKAA